MTGRASGSGGREAGAHLSLSEPSRGVPQRGRCERRGASRSGVTNHLRIDRTSPIPSGRGTWHIIEFAGLKVRAERGRGSDRDRRTLPVAPATIAAQELEPGSGSENFPVSPQGVGAGAGGAAVRTAPQQVPAGRGLEISTPPPGATPRASRGEARPRDPFAFPTASVRVRRRRGGCAFFKQSPRFS